MLRNTSTLLSHYNGADLKLSNLNLCSAIENRVIVVKNVSNWIEAISIAGKLLAETGVIEERYTDAMIKVTQQLGPYAVITPGVAMPHARPEDGARRVGISLVVVSDGINFGSPNDPVYLVIGFAAVDKTQHLRVLKELADFLGINGIIEKIRKSSSSDEIFKILEEYCYSK